MSAPGTFPGREGDWTYAQVQYETTQKSCDEIAAAIGVPATSVISRASRYQWTRNKVSTLVMKTAEITLAAKLSKEDEFRIRFEAIEKVNVAMQAEMLATHRTDIRKAKSICLKLYDNLNEAVSDVSSDPEDRMGLMDSSMVMSRLATSLKTLILLERQAYGVTTAIEDPEVEQPVASVPTSALNAVLDKFASVLQASEPRAPVRDMGIVVEVQP